MENTAMQTRPVVGDKMDVFDRKRMEQALMGPRYAIAEEVKGLEAIRALILSKAPVRYDAVAECSLWNGEENT